MSLELWFDEDQAVLAEDAEWYAGKCYSRGFWRWLLRKGPVPTTHPGYFDSLIFSRSAPRLRVYMEVNGTHLIRERDGTEGMVLPAIDVAIAWKKMLRELRGIESIPARLSIDEDTVHLVFRRAGDVVTIADLVEVTFSEVELAGSRYLARLKGTLARHIPATIGNPYLEDWFTEDQYRVPRGRRDNRPRA